jgi:ATP-dependent DNA helicase RecG
MSGFFVEFRKDICFKEYLESLVLYDRQVQAVQRVKEKGKITNRDYQSLFGVSKATATRDLSELEEKESLINRGTKGSSAIYVLYKALYVEAIGGNFL